MPKQTNIDDRQSILTWLAAYRDQTQNRVTASNGRYRAIARCELATVRAILQSLRNGEDRGPYDTSCDASASDRKP